MNPRKVLTIGLAEWRNTVFARGFILAVLLTPFLILVSVAVQNAVKEQKDERELKVAVADAEGRVFEALKALADKRKESPKFTFELDSSPVSKELHLSFSDRVRSGEIIAYLAVEKNSDGRHASYHARRHTFTELPRWLSDSFGLIFRRLTLEDAGLDSSLAESLLAPVPFKWRGLAVKTEAGEIAEPGKIDLAAAFAVPAAAMMLLFTIVFMSVPMLLHGVIEEKQQRIWEFLVSSVTPFELLLGKLLGAAFVSMTLSIFYVSGAVFLAVKTGAASSIPVPLYAWFFLFQLLALLIYGSLFSAIGAACSELRDAQSLMAPAMFVIVLPMFGWVAILRDPESSLSVALSLFPPATPMLMLLRIALPPGPRPWEIILGVLLTGAFTAASVWAAGRIFRAGILAQGQAPSLKRMWEWLRA